MTTASLRELRNVPLPCNAAGLRTNAQAARSARYLYPRNFLFRIGADYAAMDTAPSRSPTSTTELDVEVVCWKQAVHWATFDDDTSDAFEALSRRFI
jgi:hypothetical protein